MKVLVTGGRGFIGRRFVKRFERLNYEVVVVDLKDGIDLRDYCKESEEVFDLIVHCAAIVGGRATINGEPLRVATDLSIDAELFNWALRTGQKKIVYFSSSAAYPVEYQTDDNFQLLQEDMIDFKTIKMPDMTYGWAKLTGEFLAQFAREAGIEVYVFRPTSGYDEDQDDDYPFSQFIKRAKNKENPFIVWGDGEQTRDFIHVDDIVEGVLTAVQKGIQGPTNLCTGRQTSFNDLARMVMAEAGYEAEIKNLTDKPVGVRHRVGNPDNLLKFYDPKITLKEGIKRCFEK